MTGAEMIAAERQRQIDEEDEDGDLISAALAYLNDPDYWPWYRSSFKPFPDVDGAASIRDLVKAGALIAAEIDRLQRTRK